MGRTGANYRSGAVCLNHARPQAAWWRQSQSKFSRELTEKGAGFVFVFFFFFPFLNKENFPRWRCDGGVDGENLLTLQTKKRQHPTIRPGGTSPLRSMLSEQGHRWPENRFLMRRTKPPCCDVEEQWWRARACVSALGQVDDAGFGSEPRARRGGPRFHVKGYSSFLEGLHKIMQPRVMHWSVRTACCAGGVPGRRVGRISMLAKKRPPLLCGWTWTAWRHRQREEKRPNWIPFQTTPPTLLWTDAATPFSTSTPGSVSLRTLEFAFPAPSERVQDRCHSSSESWTAW